MKRTALGMPSYRLTSCDQPMAEMADRLVDMIVRRIEPASMNVLGQLVIRQST